VKRRLRARTGRIGALGLLVVLGAGCGGGGNAAELHSGGAAKVKMGPGVTDKSITVGVLGVLTGPVALQGLPIANGNEAFFKHVNDDLGGVAGRKIIVNEQDHQYNAQTAYQIFAQQDPDVAMFAQLFGTPIVAALEPRLKASGVLTIPSSYGSQFYSDPQLIVPFAPYTIQLAGGLDYAVSKLDGASKKWAIISRDDALGADGLAGFNYAAKEHGLDVVSRQTYEPTDTDFTAQLQAIKDSGANAVVLADTSAVTAQLVVGLTRLGVHALWLGWQPSFDPSLSKNPGFMSVVAKDKYYIAATLPAWSNKTPAMDAVRKAQERYFPKQAPDPEFTFGYVQGELTYEILNAAAAQGDLSREGIRAAVKDLGTTDLGGLLTRKVDFSKPPQARFPRAVQIWAASASDPSYQAPVTDDFTGEAAASYPMPSAK
jgi:ABC-type branched-subunit amino acid transport system substrate-binding protein